MKLDSLQNSSQKSNETQCENLEIIRQANENVLSAMIKLAYCYYSGDERFPQDDNGAFFWSKKVTDNYPSEVPGVWDLLGRCYQFGVGTEVDYSLAVKAYTKSASLGWAEGMYDLAEIYYFDAPESDKYKCVEWLKKAHSLGFVKATALLGHLYTKKLFGLDDSKKGIKLLLQAASQGDTESARLLAEIYMQGALVSRNIQQANYYWTLAVKNGDDNIKAIYYAGLAWYNGVGVEQDFARARWCLEQTDFDDSNAIVGSMCFEGIGGIVDRAEGERRLRKAIESNDPDISLPAMNNLGLYFYEASEHLEEAIELLRFAAAEGNADAQVNLGKAYYEGKGVSQDTKEAKHYFMLAADQGHPVALNNLKAMGMPIEMEYDDTMDIDIMKTDSETSGEKRYSVRGGIKGFLIGLLIAVIISTYTSSALLQSIPIILCIIIGVRKR